MIRPLRQRHRLMAFALGALLPVTFVFGMAARHEVPIDPTRNGPLPAASHWTELWHRDDLWEGRKLNTRLLTNSTSAQSVAIELRGQERIVRPDLLVYWTPQTGKFSGSLPDDVFLLGSFAQSFPAPLRLPPQSIVQRGVLIIYSLAEQEIIAVSRPLELKP